MKAFLIKLLLIITLQILILLLLGVFVNQQPIYAVYLLGQNWLNTKERIRVANNDIRNDTLIVGCSVSAQIFPFNGNNHLTTNGSTYAIGNYFLIRDAINNNDNINCVIYMSVPDVIGHKLARERTYTYFVKPFFTFKNYPMIKSSEEVYNLLAENPWLFLNFFTAYNILSFDEYNYSDGILKPIDKLSVESIEWMTKIYHLCKQNNVAFYIASPPVPISKYQQTNDWSNIRNQLKNTELEEVFVNYFSTILYYKDEFLTDGLHWESGYINQRRNSVRKHIFHELFQ